MLVNKRSGEDPRELKNCFNKILFMKRKSDHYYNKGNRAIKYHHIYSNKYLTLPVKAIKLYIKNWRRYRASSRG